MKQLLLLIGLSLLAAAGLNAQVVYVDVDADGGNNDGTSWANAYTNLATAIDSSAAGSELWIAEGRYVTPDTTSFEIFNELSLLGGFSGVETEAEQSDPSKFSTVLSGDVLGNDPEGRYDSLLTIDNNRVLVVIDTAETTSFTVTIDGLTIRDGVIAENFAGENLLSFAGGGIYAEAQLRVSRVLFTANRADFGSATCSIFGPSSGTSFDRITSRGNYAGLRNIHYVRLNDNVSFTNSTFEGQGRDTEMESGMLYFLEMFNCRIDNCTFDDVNIPGYLGGAIRTFDVLGQDINNCTFTGLSAVAGGALFMTNTDLFQGQRPVDARECIIDSCRFVDNVTSNSGGAIYTQNLSYAILNSEFVDNFGGAAEGFGGALFSQFSDTLGYQYRVLDSEFSGNETRIVGGAITYPLERIDAGIAGCTFDGNFSGGDGGAVYVVGVGDNDLAFQAIGNTFTNNEAAEFGAAMLTTDQNSLLAGNTFTGHVGRNGTLYVGGGGKQYVIANSEFSENGTVTNPSFPRGAALWAGLVAGETADQVLVDSTLFSNNVVTSDDFISGGGAIYADGDAGNTPQLFVSNSVFQNNSAVDQTDGGAILLVNGVEMTVVNSDFSANNAQSGGAISTARTVDSDTINNIPMFSYRTDDEPLVNLRRTLFVNNTASNQGGAIDLTSTSINVENSIFLRNSVSLGGGSGGAIIINGSGLIGGDRPIVGAELDNTMVNNTFYGNVDGNRPGDNSTPASVGNHVAIFQAGGTNPDTNSVALTIQNNAFVLDGPDEEAIGIELNVGSVADPTGFGAISITSLGGNYFNSALDATVAITGATDQDIYDDSTPIDELFVDPFQDDLVEGFDDVTPVNSPENPLLDGGTTGSLVPEIGFFGNPRGDMPDIGAIEIMIDPSGVDATPIEQSGLALDFFPNPTVNVVNIVSRDNQVGPFTVMVTDQQGRFLAGRRITTATSRLDVSALPSGIYNLQLLIDGKVYSKRIVKQ